MGLSQDAVKKVGGDVYHVIQTIARALKINIPLSSMPEIDIQGGDSSSYNRQRNIINIAQNSIGRGEAYASEAGHFVRDYITGKVGEKEATDLRELRVVSFLIGQGI